MKKALPDVGDLVVVTIEEVKNFGANVKLEEYPGITGFIHISEVATGWVKHIKDYLRAGQKTVCKVLNVDPSRTTVELSLKRVNDHQKREKISQWKEDQKAAKLLEIVAKTLKKSVEECEEEFVGDLIARYGSLYAAFEDAASSDDWLPDKKGKWKSVFAKVAKENITIPFVKIGGYVEAYSLASDGIDRIKSTLAESGDSGVTIQYAGAPKYRLTVRDKDFKNAENTLRKVVQKLADAAKKNGVTLEFKRE
ncbi:MAG: translation initiation factor IF-2 subunit alpha [Thermoplasmataceae archaeon]